MVSVIAHHTFFSHSPMTYPAREATAANGAFQSSADGETLTATISRAAPPDAYEPTKSVGEWLKKL